MTFLVNEPARFAAQAVDGLVAAHPGRIVRTPGGVMRAGAGVRGEVAIVTGGGAGHYPAFGGLVGRGLAHAAALGDVFASPSARQILDVARAAHRGGGVLLVFGNYAGDVLNFERAAELLRADGIACATIAVADDVASAPVEHRDRRRGIAGDVVVLKVAAAVAESGAPLAAVLSATQRMNRCTRSLGVAFSGCTLPGASAPLFTVPAGSTAVGMGIHGEPGLELIPTPSADDLADLLVSRVLDDLGSDEDVRNARVAVLLNGLGAVAGEELHLLYGRVRTLLDRRGITVVAPEVGELVTSFEMAGASLTIALLDEETEPAWLAPADAAAFRRMPAASETHAQDDIAPSTSAAPQDPASRARVPEASAESRSAASVAVTVLRAVEAELEDAAERLGALDAVAGDGDHGIGMLRGARSARRACERAAADGAGLGTALAQAGDAWADDAGGTSGMLWGLLLDRIARACGDAAIPRTADIAAAVSDAADEIARRGGARIGDKTLLDVLAPFGRALAGSDGPLPLAWSLAADVAEAAAAATADLLPGAGRARTHAERSIGTPDPGAVSLALVLRVVDRVIDQTDEKE
ncbi:dihydroxyacetone kinase family protein [Microbacterium tumbae]